MGVGSSPASTADLPTLRRSRPLIREGGRAFAVPLPSPLRDLLGRRRTRWLLLAASAFLIVAGAATVELLRIRNDLHAGRAELNGIDLSTVDDNGGIAAVADRAADRLDDAADRARSSPVLRALSVVPGVGNQVDAIRDMTAAVAELGGHGRQAAAAIEEAVDSSTGSTGRLDVVRTARAELARLHEAAEAIELGAGGWLIPPLHEIRRSVSIDLADARSDLERSAQLAGALEAFLTGPRRYLVLGGNNAEMRAVGIPTTSGIADIADGAINVGEFSAATDAIELPEPGVPVPLEYENLYGWLNGDRGYRTTLATANWPVAAEIAAAITDRNMYGHVDGIIYVDTITLEWLLRVIGPVEVGGVEYTAENVVSEILYRNYLRFETTVDSPERRALQSEVAQTIFRELETRDYPVLELAGALSNLARGRHLLAWSADEEENRLWEAFGADGRLLPDGLLVVSEELGASKLDYFVKQEVEVSADEIDDGWRVTLEVHLYHSEHGETSPYIDGGGIYAEAGEYGSFLVAYVPGNASDIESETGFTHHGRDGPMYAVGTILRVPENTTKVVEISFTLPPGEDALTVIPSARLYGTTWHWGDTQRVDDRPFVIELDDA